MRRAANRYLSESSSSAVNTNPSQMPGMFNPNQAPPVSSVPTYGGLPQASVRPYDPTSSQPNAFGTYNPSQPNLNNPTPNVLEPQQQVPPQPYQQQQPTLTPAALDSNVPRGWNDPPPLSSKKVSFNHI